MDVIRRLEVWTSRWKRTKGPRDQQAIPELRALLGELRTYEDKTPSARGPAARALLELTLLEDGTESQQPMPHSPPRMGRKELERRLDDEDEERSAPARDVLAGIAADPEADVSLRMAAVELLAGRFLTGTLASLLTAARSVDPALRDLAQRAVAGWPNAGLHEFFLEELAAERASVEAVRVHFDTVQDDLTETAWTRLRDAVGTMLRGESWRVATRAGRLVPLLDTPRAVPLLIESLRVWNERMGTPNGSRRIRQEILWELQRRSGRSLGTRPESWELWWQRVNDGSIALPDEGEGRVFTSASFFGLPVVSDRLVFVLDRSASMKETFGTGRRSRYDEAIDQLLRYLDTSGPETRFGVVFFNDRPQRWKRSLVEATEANRTKLTRWLAKLGPAGSTHLQDAVFDAVGYKRGKLKLEALEADTVVVLCDGETFNGPDWVRPWLEEIEGAEVIFHCVQVGGESDGTLRQLARISGGELVEVGT